MSDDEPPKEHVRVHVAQGDVTIDLLFPANRLMDLFELLVEAQRSEEVERVSLVDIDAAHWDGSTDPFLF